ncbi:hypothetical protein LCGC14_1332090 [marine sediment metagenome]|uniref:Uncharacterized protein n=1 Tax=marine sediment metagenome TaxID=412755 RepID=A0A0F9L289_9ZZZZ
MTHPDLKNWKGEGHFVRCSSCLHYYFPEAFEVACPHKKKANK